MYYAEIINNKVARVLVVEGTTLEATRWLRKNISKNRWVKTCINESFRYKYAGKGDEFHKDLNAFVAPKPYPSWILDEEKKKYKAPKDKPPVGNYTWDEDKQLWMPYENIV